MRRFEPTYAGCGDCALSFTIPTSPGRNARTVSGFNRQPIYAVATAVFALRFQQGPRSAGRGASSSCDVRDHHPTPRSSDRGRPCVAGQNYKQMNALSKDAVNWHAVGEDGDGQRVDNYLARILKGVPKSHVYRILRSGEVRVNRRRVAPDTRLNVGDQLRIPPIRTSAPPRRTTPAPISAGLPPI